MKDETLHTNQLEQQAQRSVEFELHHGQVVVDLRYGKPLMGRDQLLAEHGYDGDLMAIVSLPGEDGKDKQIGVIDYGEPDPDNPRWVLAIDNGTLPMKALGKVKARYGLVAFNYGGEQIDPRRDFVDMPEGEAVELGSQEDVNDTVRAIYHLGLDGKNSGNEDIEPQHATLQIKDGQMTVQDHSTKGTKVRFGNHEAAKPAVEIEKVQKELGDEALDAAGVEEPAQASVSEKTDGQKMAELTADLSDEDRAHLRYYASAMQDKRAAQNKGNGEASIYFGQAAGQHYHDLSPAAQKLAAQYESLYVSGQK